MDSAPPFPEDHSTLLEGVDDEILFMLAAVFGTGDFSTPITCSSKQLGI